MLLGFDWRLSLLYGAVLSSTDAAAVFSTLRRLPLRPRLVAIVEAESGMNDAIVVLLVVMLSAAVDRLPLDADPRRRCFELVGGALIGLAVGAAGAWALRRVALPPAGLYPLAAVGLTVFAYAIGAIAHVSGFIAIYVAGIVLGNAKLPHRQAILGFADGLGWLAQIGLFVLLGLLASPARLVHAVMPGLIIGAILLFAGPAALGGAERDAARVRLARAGCSCPGPGCAARCRSCSPPYRCPKRSPGAVELFDVVFVVVVIFTIVQGTTLPPVARFARVTAASQPTELRVETAPLDRMQADLLEFDIPIGSKLTGVYIDELRLPVGAVVTMVLRDGVGFVPERRTRLRGSGQSLDRGDSGRP